MFSLFTGRRPLSTEQIMDFLGNSDVRIASDESDPEDILQQPLFADADDDSDADSTWQIDRNEGSESIDSLVSIYFLSFPINI